MEQIIKKQIKWIWILKRAVWPVWLGMLAQPITLLALERLRQEDDEFEASLGYNSETLPQKNN
jgi:hypothetical protein